ncbi:unnamed protein product [Musa acuminata subsp. malaccensis]|uniref:(wild Malaysian banana) hypothetical protein n=1 Tax=Musa acuminata subsp. malaccensis TaxID=214687 RepID=A0A804L9P2_MUSAM|nr:unnamed protein product [Musa acuminata subsp. malaccensis]
MMHLLEGSRCLINHFQAPVLPTHTATEREKKSLWFICIQASTCTGQIEAFFRPYLH